MASCFEGGWVLVSCGFGSCFGLEVLDGCFCVCSVRYVFQMGQPFHFNGVW